MDVDDISPHIIEIPCYYNIRTTSVVIYHSACSDGVMSRVIIERELGDDVIYIPSGHNATTTSITPTLCPFPDIPTLSADTIIGKNVLLVDICFGQETLEELRRLSSGLFILDHHSSSLEQVTKLHTKHYHISMLNAACVLTWRIFHGPKRLPLLLKYIEDNDLGKWVLSDSRFFSAGYRSLGSRVLDSAALLERGDNGVKDMILAGKTLSRTIESNVSRIVKTAGFYRSREFPSIVLRVVNSNEYIAELCELLSAGKDIISCCWYYDHTNSRFKFSLRGKTPTTSSRDIAETYGGGGHDAAAAFTSPTNPIFTGTWLPISKNPLIIFSKKIGSS